jgi:hypothetical protein
LPWFRLLPKVHSLRLAGKRVFPGDEFELDEEQAKRLNTDTFVKVEPEQAPPPQVEEPETAAVAPVLQEPQAKLQLEVPASVPQNPKRSNKRSAFAGTKKP